MSVSRQHKLNVLGNESTILGVMRKKYVVSGYRSKRHEPVIIRNAFHKELHGRLNDARYSSFRVSSGVSLFLRKIAQATPIAHNMSRSQTAYGKPVVLNPGIVQNDRSRRGHFVQVLLVKHPLVITKAYERRCDDGASPQERKCVGLRVQRGLVVLRRGSVDEVAGNANEVRCSLRQTLCGRLVVPVVQIGEKCQIRGTWYGIEGFDHCLAPIC